MKDDSGKLDPDVLRKIRALLAKAESTEFVDEAEALTDRAHRLLAKYGMDHALLDARDPAHADRVVAVYLPIDSPYTTSKAEMLAAIALAMRCMALTRRTLRAERTLRAIDGCELWGYEADVTRTEVLFTSLLVQADRGMVRAMPKDPDENLGAFRRSWRDGFTVAIVDRINAAEAQAQAAAEAQQHRDREARGALGAGPSVSLVLADRRTAVERAVRQKYPTLRSARQRSASEFTGTGYHSGYDAGKEADMGVARLGEQPSTPAIRAAQNRA